MHQYLFEIQLPFIDRVFAVPGYGVTILLAGMVAVLYLMWKGERVGIDRFTAVLLIVELLAVGLLGSMIWDYLWTFVLNTLGIGLGPLGGQPGLAWMGAVLGATLFGIWYIRFLKLDLTAVLDLLAPLFLITYAIGRCACLLGGCCYGSPTEMPWGITYPLDLPHYCAPGGMPLHPTPIYASLGGLIALGLLFALRRFLQRPGQIFLVALGLHSLFRIVEEFFRADHTTFLVALSLTQWASLASILIVAYLLLVHERFAIRRSES